MRIKVKSRIHDGIKFDTNINVNNVHNKNSRTQNYLKVNKKETNFKRNNSKDPNKDKKTGHVLIAEKWAIIFVSADF